jgi:hypothetical protein
MLNRRRTASLSLNHRTIEPPLLFERLACFEPRFSLSDLFAGAQMDASAKTSFRRFEISRNVEGSL